MIKKGDLVQYSVNFLQSTGQYTGEVPFLKGRVVSLSKLGAGTTLAQINWLSDEDHPQIVNVGNLEKVKIYIKES